MPSASPSRRSFTLGSLGAAVTFGSAGAQQPPAKLVLGTATPGGGFPLFGAAVQAGVQEADPTLTLETINTKGSTENVPLLEAGRIDLGLCTGEVAYEAMAGIGRTASGVRIAAAMYPTAGMFVARGDNPARTIRDLVGKRVIFGARGSGLVVLARYALDGLGLDPDKDFTPVYLERAGDGPAMVLDGSAAALWGGGIGWPGFETVAKGPQGARFIVPDASEIDRITTKHAFLKRLSMPAGAYPGIAADLPSVGSWSVILARPGLDDALAYRFAKALHQAEGGLGRRLAQAAATTARNTLAAAPKPDFIHPGVVRYLREAGITG
ncbi:TAXI family TRAP transporter solute-binding subunit [Phreatobacter aquaticus]|uniref:TAXI family TRAP transporter solute-binding subunit n=1 Tax=Phreatobacter aquaticus TaxID=2570229 RepID=A0A4D7QM22_9HYPH|nr:TAXI family TRAP transporter solute-binding subunit [Phreatobacter aquaticus]QCK86466.1 TAXI family TRAP transporter solute-binding subunit [Phreatobacter aquaticus]